MLVEQLFFTILAFGLFVYIFLKMVQRNDTNYIYILVMQAIAIAINFIGFINGKKLENFSIFIKYLFGIAIPILVIWAEKKDIPLIQIVSVIKAKIYLKLNNSSKAKEVLINLVTKLPNNYIGHKMLAEIYELEGGMRKAIDEYVKAIDINKHDYDSYFKIAELLNNLQKQDEATEMLTNLLSKKPDYSNASHLLGDILISKEMYKEAANVYQNALKYDPLNYDFNYNLGIAYTMLNDFQTAKICYEKAAEINSLSYNSKYALAEIALIYKEIEEAEKYFMQAVDDENLSADSYFELSKISIIRSDFDTAVKYANIAIDEDAKDIVPKIKKDPMFIPIIAKLSMPLNLENVETKENKMDEKSKKMKEHLEEMFEITQNLSYSDIKLLKKDDIKKEDKNYNIEKQKEIGENN